MPDKTPTLLNIAAVNGADPAPPEDESDRNEWLQGDLDLKDQKRQEQQDRSDAAYAFYTGQDDSELTSKPGIVDNAHPAPAQDTETRHAPAKRAASHK
jgi:hypothetical protein